MDRKQLTAKVIARFKQADFIHTTKDIPEVGDIVTKIELPEKEGYPCKIYFKSGKSVVVSLSKK